MALLHRARHGRIFMLQAWQHCVLCSMRFLFRWSSEHVNTTDIALVFKGLYPTCHENLGLIGRRCGVYVSFWCRWIRIVVKIKRARCSYALSSILTQNIGLTAERLLAGAHRWHQIVSRQKFTKSRIFSGEIWKRLKKAKIAWVLIRSLWQNVEILDFLVDSEIVKNEDKCLNF